MQNLLTLRYRACVRCSHDYFCGPLSATAFFGKNVEVHLIAQIRMPISDRYITSTELEQLICCVTPNATSERLSNIAVWSVKRQRLLVCQARGTQSLTNLMLKFALNDSSRHSIGNDLKGDRPGRENTNVERRQLIGVDAYRERDLRMKMGLQQIDEASRPHRRGQLRG
jgi:hypothetical protein